MPPFCSLSLPFALLVLLSISLSISLSLSLARPLSTASGDQQKTMYGVLNENGLPMGLLPKGIERFSIDDDGNFEVFLAKVCTAKVENEVRYETNVTGTISYGQIGALKGISSQELFLWFPVKGIRVDIPNSGVIYFDVGVIYKQFSFSSFEIPPECEDAVVSDRNVDDGEETAGILSEVQPINSVKLRSSVLDASTKAIQ